MRNGRTFVVVVSLAVLVAAAAGFAWVALHLMGRLSASQTSALPVLYEAPYFSLRDQNDKPFSSNDLAGKVWVVDLIFTACHGPCPVMTGKMAELQKLVLNQNVHLVTLTVDPENDTPAVLRKYAVAHGANLQRWTFLTGPGDAVYAMARGLALGTTPGNGDALPEHDTHFLLIDGGGHVRGIYGMADGAALAKIAADAKALAEGR